MKLPESGDELTLQPRPLLRGCVGVLSLEADDSHRLHPLQRFQDFLHRSIQKLAEEVDRNREVAALGEKQFHHARELSSLKRPQLVGQPRFPPSMGRSTDGTGMPTSKGWEVEVEAIAPETAAAPITA